MPGSGSNIGTEYATVFQARSSREEIVLLFGNRQAVREEQEEVTVHLKERIILSPFTAKRLAIMLANDVREYESRYGPLEAEFPPSTGLDQIRSPWPKPSFFKTEIAGEKASLVLHLVENLNIKFGFEQSLKILEKTLLANRFLLGFKKKRIRQEPHEKILDICGRMDMPENFLEAYRKSLPDSNYLHFGFEENERTCLYKAYLEFYDKVENEIKNQPGKFDSYLMHLGFKWDAGDESKRALTKYTS